jgi:hypothetical protein
MQEVSGSTPLISTILSWYIYNQDIPCQFPASLQIGALVMIYHRPNEPKTLSLRKV